MKSKINSIIFYLLLTTYHLLLVNGCGYTTKTVLPDNIKTVHVGIFKNNINITKEVSAKDKYEVYRPNLEIDLRDAIVDRVFLDGHLKSSALDYADGILEGEILQYRKDPLRYQNKDVTEYRISLVCDIRLVNSKTEEILLELEDVIGDTTYFTTGSLQKSETLALAKATRDLARTIVDSIVESW